MSIFVRKKWTGECCNFLGLGVFCVVTKFSSENDDNTVDD